MQYIKYMKFIPYGPIKNQLTLVQVVAWHRTADGPSVEPAMTQPADACMHLLTPMGYIKPTSKQKSWLSNVQ